MIRSRGAERKRQQLSRLAAEAEGCRACPLYAQATQTVFGHGPARARLMLVGEQPGDEEDTEGLPFVGPAGRLLTKALEDAAIDPQTVYLTNVVKHFKWRPGPGWKRLHQKPNRKEVQACLPWLESEVAAVEPELVVGLGSTACQALLGPEVRVTEHRRSVGVWGVHPVMIAVHPSSVLRARDSEARRSQYRELVKDMETARHILAEGGPPSGVIHAYRVPLGGKGAG